MTTIRIWWLTLQLRFWQLVLRLARRAMRR